MFLLTVDESINKMLITLINLDSRDTKCLCKFCYANVSANYWHLQKNLEQSNQWAN